MGSRICNRLTRSAAVLALLSQFLLLAVAQEAPCIDPTLTPADLAYKLNPRPSGDVTVLLNMPFDSIFCSEATSARFLIFGDWSERHQLDLAASRPNTDLTNADVRSHLAWRVVNVSAASSMADFDFLVDESQGLKADAEYFVAVRGCNSHLCSTVGVTRFTAWGNKTALSDSKLFIIIGSCLAVVAVVIILIVAVVRCRNPDESKIKAGIQGQPDFFNLESGSYLRADKLDQRNQRGRQRTVNDNGANVYQQPDQLFEMDSVLYEQIDDCNGEQVNPNPQLTTESNAYDEAEDQVAISQQQRLAVIASTEGVSNPDYGHQADQTSSSEGTRKIWVNGSNNPAYNHSDELLLSKNDVDGRSREIINESYEIQSDLGLQSGLNVLGKIKK